MRNLIVAGITIFLLQCKSSQSDTLVSNASLTNTYWKLTEVAGKSVTTPADSREVHIVLSSEGSNQNLKGFAGCNSMGGNYTLEGNNNVRFSIMTTKMYCNDRMDVENLLTNALSQTTTYLIKGEKLELYTRETLLARFESVYFN